ncbi:glycosyltransferase, partial [Priestia megaterium]
AKQRKIPTIFTVHGTYYPKSELLKVVELASATICVSPPVYEYVQEETSVEPILIANGIDTEEYSERDVRELKTQLNIPKEAFVLLYSSRINWTKANICMMLLRACKDVKLSKAPHLHVVVVGDGPRFKDLQSLTDLIHRTCKDSFIHLVGEKQDMQHYYPIADCVVGTGRVALEAMACTKPVLAVGNHGYFGLVDKNEYDNAWNYYFGDHNSRHACSRFTLARDLGAIIASSQHLKNIGVQSREWILNKFDVTKVTEELIELYIDKIKGDTT